MDMIRVIGLGIAALVLSLVVGGLAGWLIRGAVAPPVEVIEGFTGAVNYDGTAIGLGRERGSGGPGYNIAGVWWREAGGSWSNASPTCVKPLTQGQKVRLGVIWVEPSHGAPGGPKVVWLECLDMNYVPMEPPAVAAARQALATRLGVNPNLLRLTSVEEVLWGNTSLGCPEPGKEYAQVIVNGFRVRFEHEDHAYEYHTNVDGSMLATC